MSDSPFNGWHIDKRLSIGHIGTTIAVAISLIVWMLNIEKRVDINTVGLVGIEKRVERVDGRNSVQFAQILDRLAKIQDRLDRIAGK